MMSGSVLGAVLLLALSFAQGSNVSYSYRTEYYSQTLDHFNFADERRFQQRYLINTATWTANGPIFFYCGNEGDISWFCANTGMVWDIAPSFQAMVVFAEHRYYGKSLPFGNDSYKDAAHLNYLSSPQALADFVELISHLRTTIDGARDSPVIAIGGSYGGMLAAWLRMKYPSAVQGALAASAPIWQFGDLTPCASAYKTITRDFSRTYPKCATNIAASWPALQSLGSTGEGRLWLEKTFRLCKPLKSSSLLSDWLEEIYFNLAMVDYPYPATFLEPLPAWPVDKVCSALRETATSEQELLRSVFSAVSVYFNYTGDKACLDLSQTAILSLGVQGWDYQACTEMIMPLCSDGEPSDMFRRQAWSLAQLTEGCMKTYGVKPRPNAVIEEYGGKDIKQHSNIVFSNGALDPWSGGGVLQNISDTLVAIVIPNGAHHLDIRAATREDPPEVVAARKLEQDLFRYWIQQHWATGEVTRKVTGEI